MAPKCTKTNTPTNITIITGSDEGKHAVPLGVSQVAAERILVRISIHQDDVISAHPHQQKNVTWENV
jgi:hypothetical protein